MRGAGGHRLVVDVHQCCEYFAGLRSARIAVSSTPDAVTASRVLASRCALFENQLTNQLTAEILAQLLPISGRGCRLWQ